MKKHTQIAKLLTAFFSGVLVMTLVGSAIAATPTAVTPNFTSLKIGTTSAPSTGGIRAQGIIQAGTAIKTSNLMPTSTSISVLGSLSVEDDLTVAGGMTANSFGVFYTVNEYCNDAASSITNCTAYTYNSAWNQLEASCDTGDTVVACEGWPMSSDDPASYYSWANDSNSCFTMSDAPGIQTQAICFSPDGERTSTTTLASVSSIGASLPTSFSDSVDDYMTEAYPTLTTLSTVAEFDNYLDDYLNEYVTTELDTILVDMGYVTETTFDTYIDTYNFATQSYVNTKLPSSTSFPSR
ncbi:hypothetical protein COT83_02345 [Candidatus Peregrinibacteria bacterium CG10_big_fil_rev_8_21_14_0_10_44_7]|nr:MAG: hypothetical protein COT83_02345 [Candidatus Peregrinibacteria bacterium CG10_big_fil_rev_8_21_14_0_10_44_7]